MRLRLSATDGELLRARHGELVREVAGGETLGAPLDLAHLAADPPRHVQTDSAASTATQRAEGDAPVERRRAHGSRAVSGIAARTTAVTRPSSVHRHGDVHHVLCSVALRRMSSPGGPAARPDLRPVAVVLHGRGIATSESASTGAGGTPAVGGDQGDARARRAPQPLHEPLELLRVSRAGLRPTTCSRTSCARAAAPLGVAHVEVARGAHGVERRPRPCTGRRRRGRWRRCARRAAAYARLTRPAGGTPRRAPSRCRRPRTPACGAARRCARRPSGRSRSGR